MTISHHRKFGIEVEFMGDTAAALTALREAGLSQRHSLHSYGGHDESQWVVKLDGSVYGGGEMVSPPLWFDEPAQRDQVTAAIDALRLSGARPDDRAGIHIHIDGSGMSHEDLQRIVRCFYKFEDVLYRLASSGWPTIRSAASSYAWPLAEGQVKALVNAKDLRAFTNAWYNDPYYDERRGHGHGSRYCAINLHSWFYRKTIEFRLFISSLNPERVQAYIAICMALVNDALAGNNRNYRQKRYPLGGMLAGTTVPANALHRFQQVLRYEAGMSLDDMRRVTACWADSVPQAPIRSNSSYAIAGR